MDLKTQVKVSEVTNLSDARYCAGMGVQFIGFNLDKEEERSIDDTNFTAITQWLEGITVVGEFKSSSIEEIHEVIQKHHLSHIELTQVDMLHAFESEEITIFLRLDESMTFEEINEHCEQLSGEVDAFIIESPISWEEVAQLSSTYRVMVTQKLDPSSIVNDLATYTPFGIELKGGDEERPGFKSFDELADILEVLENDPY